MRTCAYLQTRVPLQVADFLRDEETVLRAAAAASVLLFSPVQKAEIDRCMHGPSKSWRDSAKVCDKDVQELLSLESRLSEAVLRAMDSSVTAGPVQHINEDYSGMRICAVCFDRFGGVEALQLPFPSRICVSA